MLGVNTLDDWLAKPLVVVLAKTTGCGVCEDVKEQLQELAILHPQIPFLTIDLMQNPKFRGEYLVFTAPTIIIFSRGKEIARESRFINFERINQIIRNN